MDEQSSLKVFSWIIGAIVIVAVIIAVIFYLVQPKNQVSTDTTATSTEQTATTTDNSELVKDISWKTYVSPTYHFTVSYPATFSVNKNVTFDQLGADKQINGVAYGVSSEYTKGTNLSTDSKIIVGVADTLVCDSVTYNIPNGKALPDISVNGQVFHGIQVIDPAAGNIYDVTLYYAKVGNKCYGLGLYLHSGNIQNYPEGAVTEYNKPELEAVYAYMLNHFEVN
jgi:hypothetical protein